MVQSVNYKLKSRVYKQQAYTLKKVNPSLLWLSDLSEVSLRKEKNKRQLTHSFLPFEIPAVASLSLLLFLRGIRRDSVQYPGSFTLLRLFALSCYQTQRWLPGQSDLDVDQCVYSLSLLFFQSVRLVLPVYLCCLSLSVVAFISQTFENLTSGCHFRLLVFPRRRLISFYKVTESYFTKECNFFSFFFYLMKKL